MVRKILKINDGDNTCLRTPCHGSPTPQQVQDLIDTAGANKLKCAGLAANQIGNTGCVFVVKIACMFKVFIDPEIVELIGKPVNDTEGCMSCPGTVVNVKRYPKVRIKYKTHVQGEFKESVYKGFTARVIQHEYDHLKGKLIVDGVV